MVRGRFHTTFQRLTDDMLIVYRSHEKFKQALFDQAKCGRARLYPGVSQIVLPYEMLVSSVLQERVAVLGHLRYGGKAKLTTRDGSLHLSGNSGST